jgi:signal-transduction protein with cAMP-binding, CBS, and nucleotidyltransferase domain
MAPMPEERTSRPTDPVANLLTGEPVSVNEKLTLRSIAAVLAADEIGAVLVHGEGEPHGIVSERDVARALAADVDPDEVWSADVMTEPVRSVDARTPILAVAVHMVADDIRHLAVTEKGQVIGVVSSRDVFRVLTVDALEARGAVTC